MPSRRARPLPVLPSRVAYLFHGQLARTLNPAAAADINRRRLKLGEFHIKGQVQVGAPGKPRNELALMSAFRRTSLLALLVLLLGGIIFLVTWDIPPPTHEVEIVIPDSQLPR